MLYDALMAEARRNDSLDDVRSAALDRSRWLVDLLERRRTEFRRSMGPECQRFEAEAEATRAEIDGRPTGAMGAGTGMPRTGGRPRSVS